MSDFLQRLIANEFESSTAVAPRSPTWFEAAQPFAEPAGDETVTGERDRPTSTYTALTPPPAPKRMASEGRVPAAPLVEKNLIERDPEIPSSVTRTSPTSPPVESTNSATPGESVGYRDTPARVIVRDHKQMLQPAIVRIAAPPAVPASPRVALRAHSEPDPVRERSIPNFQAVHVAPVSPRASTSVPQSPEVEAPTTVQISIGRLEVRAAAPASASKRREAAPQPSRLEQYLASRGGSERT